MRISACGLLLGMTAAPVIGDTGVNDLQKSTPFTVNATVVKGCVLGSGNSDVTTFGTLSFGQISSLASNVSIVSSAGAGSVLLRCNPGLSVTLALGIGNNITGSISAGRKLKNTLTTETLLYQLYQDNNYATPWGDGGNGGTAQVIAATGSTQEIKVYARLFSASTLPTSGTYNDTVLLTVTY
ncbi:spore coat U domain-containing protein [Serratia plymuthica]|uniref:Spore coat protein U domain-containing protein n=1 Tax=Serratia plymuthica TaxID=82996 RepID=A0A7T2ST83_SERPL|nr:spore coat U domain-containing protein [Serratia plymuthica]QPS21179.1 spore coat protein U domain-containing protein [Serratia plymuthica]QPS54068.1 spore coat protein U domain-containing protein [Serratia plymuthica]QPS62788.1 spore coat protein U domain-containing protein [Serratia plymuthica]RKS64892.1 spore coat protein U-like protein [Serratia plymuthica]UNK26142.1 spore coat U domain-containing protein [Serratia plymuthica]